MTAKVTPPPGGLSAQMAPPCASTMPREMGSPRPVPRTRRVRSLRDCSNFSKIRSRSSSAIPSPPFHTVKPATPATEDERSTRTLMTPLSGVNLMAFVSRFETTCPSRAASPTMRCGQAGASTTSSWPRSAAAGAYRSADARITSSRTTTSGTICSLPFSSRATSRRSSTSPFSRSADSRAMRR